MSGFIALPYKIWDRSDLNVYERCVITHIVRKTLGWGKFSDGISLSQFCDDLCISKNTAIKTLRSLEQRKLIEIDKQVLKNGARTYNKYSIHKNVINQVNISLNPSKQAGSPDAPPSAGDEPPLDATPVNKPVHEMHPPVQEMHPPSARGEQTKETNTKHKEKEQQQDREKKPVVVFDENKTEQKIEIDLSGLPSQLHKPALSIIQSLTTPEQENVIQELTAKIKNVDNPMAYLRQLVKAENNGTFTVSKPKKSSRGNGNPTSSEIIAKQKLKKLEDDESVKKYMKHYLAEINSV